MLNQVNILINLAASDNKVNDHESRILEIIARVNGVTKETFSELLAHPSTSLSKGANRWHSKNNDNVFRISKK